MHGVLGDTKTASDLELLAAEHEMTDHLDLPASELSIALLRHVLAGGRLAASIASCQHLQESVLEQVLLHSAAVYPH
jgi:hypothetical protein